MRASVKPLTHWVIYKGYRIRIRNRSAALITGIVTTADGEEVPFGYEPAGRFILIAGRRIAINDYGWEIEQVDEP